MPARGGKVYDRAYFERWYRDPSTRVHVRDSVERKVRFAVHAAEYLLEEPVTRVLDVGCGEGAWQPILKRLRPRARYTGVDPSEYAVRRYGRSRNLRRGGFGELGSLGIRGRFDLIVCSDVLHYVPDEELVPGLAALVALLEGVAFLEAFTSADDIVGDFRGMKRRPPAAYDRMFRRAGLVHCGLYCFVPRDFALGLTALERGRG